MTDHQTIIQAKEISVHYGNKKVLDNVSFDIAENEVTSIIGPLSLIHI